MPERGTVTTTTAKHRWPRSQRSVSRARAALREQLSTWRIPEDTATTAELLLSELVTNAVQHAGTPPGREIGACFALSDGLLRLEVSDACTVFPQQRPADLDAETGRGMLLITALADDWGVTPRPHGIGKTVWIELKVDPSRTAGLRPHP